MGLTCRRPLGISPTSGRSACGALVHPIGGGRREAQSSGVSVNASLSTTWYWIAGDATTTVGSCESLHVRRDDRWCHRRPRRSAGLRARATHTDPPLPCIFSPLLTFSVQGERRYPSGGLRCPWRHGHRRRQRGCACGAHRSAHSLDAGG